MVTSTRGRQGASGIFLALAVLVSGCSTTSSPPAAHESKAPLIGVGSESDHPASRYLDIAKAGNERLERDIDALSGPDKNRLRSARADLHDASVTERLFDRRLQEIPFPRADETIAAHLLSTNQARAAVTARAAASQTLRQLRGFENQISAQDKVVETQVRRIRTALDLPPPDTS